VEATISVGRTKAAGATGKSTSSGAASSGGKRAGGGDAPPRRRLSPRRAKAVLAIAVVVLLGWGGHALWRAAAPAVVGRDRYLLAADGIAITPTPEWIAADVRSQVIHNAGLDGRLSILDPGFMKAIENAFALHPWVERVDRIEKRYPPGVDVDVTYRRPVAAIDVPQGAGGMLLPVDAHGIHLPADDVPAIRREHLPRLMGIAGQPPVGQRWDDPRVAGGVELAVLLAEVWEPWHLREIIPSARPEVQVQGNRQYYLYELVTRGGTHIVWGAAPHVGAPGEADFRTKLGRLQQCIKQYGPLDSAKSPGVVNVRGELEVSPRLVKDPAGGDAAGTVVK
jgi:hypothetical protein